MEPDPDRRRGAWRQRATDIALIVLSVAIGLSSANSRLADPGAVPPALLYTDIALGLLGCLGLWWRRQYPLHVATVLIVLSSFSEVASLGALVAVFTVASRCPARTAATTAVASLLALGLFFVLRPEPAVPLWVLLLLLVSVYAAVVGWGMLVRSRRQLIESLRERAAAAEIEAALRSERAQHEARETLAREMHDVLGHRLSLLSVHAGALAFHRGASAEEAARAADVIRENAHRALQDLREVIGVLRAPVGEVPLPDVGDIGELVGETVRSGTPVELHDEHGVASGGQPVPATAGRTLYRFVQESLTNARKHAPGAPVVVRITGVHGDRLEAEVENAAPAGPPAPAPAGSGAGLRGLAERATLVGGAVEYGPTGPGGWRVGMRLPWPA
ncbi:MULTISPECIES: sensor histidine kinase [Pseudonocardia]|uniref:histidine kinase n=2 Tax=Pseudonocardia TaxID=1847 RepID=A0A1Y2MP33_PSEAH|nr:MULTISPECIES: sensor histidine kinase [Pseudonocardia]OSY36228.1 Sensor histidine kinase LiaS [Pseudonocardia autotrophica]TDN73036.1 signal transduction histidine kinase [Pseudonocardia autotrophica]BBG03754.1 two-component sensor histidine kinase [Pseudonocardia autotrophica]GEC26638.1 two-component sensor histidine kinase [Pseudonocardia saturnea]